MSSVNDTRTPRTKATRVMITSDRNARTWDGQHSHDIVNQGDTITVTPADNWISGDLMVIENKNNRTQLVYLHIGRGTVHPYMAKELPFSKGGTRYKEGELKIIGKLKQKVERQPKSKSADPIIRHAEENFLRLYNAQWDDWNFLTKLIRELTKATNIELYSQCVVGAVLRVAFERASQGRKEDGEKIRNAGRAKQVIRDIEQTIEAIQKGVDIPNEIVNEYGSTNCNQADKKREEKIEELRERINDLEDCPSREEIRFKLETEIFNLEHPPEDEDSILDAEFISGRGFTDREGGRA